MFFEVLNFIKKKNSKRPRKLSNPKPNNSEFQEKLQKHSKSYRATQQQDLYEQKKTRNSVTQPRRIVQPCCKQKLQRTKKDSSKNCNKTQSNELKKTNQKQAKIEVQSKTQSQERVNEQKLSVLMKQNSQESPERDLGTRTRNASTKKQDLPNKLVFNQKREKKTNSHY